VKEKSVSQLFLWQFVGRFILQGVGFITAPVFTRLLAPADYGQVAVYTTWAALCTPFISLQTHGSIASAKIKYGEDQIDAYLSSIFTISIISFIVFLTVALIGKDFFSRKTNLRSDLIILLVVQSFSSYIIFFFSTKLIQLKKAKSNFFLSLLSSLPGTLLSIIFLTTISGNKYVIRLYANAMPNIIIGGFLGFYIIFKGKTLINIGYWKYCLSLTVPLIFHGIGGLILVQSDRIMLQRISGEEVTGVYSFVNTFVMIIAVISNIFNSIWCPFYFEYKKNKKIDLILSKSNGYMHIFSVISTVFILLSPEVYKIIASELYWPGIKVIPIITLAYFFDFCYCFPANHEFYNEETKIISISTVCAAGVNIALNFILIPLYDDMGAAIATLTSFFFLFIFHEVIARFVIRDYNYKYTMYLKGFLPILFSCFLFYFAQQLWPVRWILGLGLGFYFFIKIIKNREYFL
jgi:O-antigen/teichoic acid export membrane protein